MCELIGLALTDYEVFKSVSRERSETQALKAVADMQLGEVVDLRCQAAVQRKREHAWVSKACQPFR